MNIGVSCRSYILSQTDNFTPKSETLPFIQKIIYRKFQLRRITISIHFTRFRISPNFLLDKLKTNCCVIYQTKCFRFIIVVKGEGIRVNGISTRNANNKHVPLSESARLRDVDPEAFGSISQQIYFFIFVIQVDQGGSSVRCSTVCYTESLTRNPF